jgi:hypothetical protein
MYFTDEALDQWAEELDLDRRLAAWRAERDEAADVDTGVMADLAHEHEVATCEHDFDIGAGQGQVMRSGAFEVLDVCVKCGLVLHTGRYDSVL